MESDRGSSTGPIVLAILKDPTAPGNWKALVDRYAPRIYGWCRKWGCQNADAEDITQQVLMGLVRHLDMSYDPTKGQFRDWLKSVAHNAWASYFKRKGRAGVGSGDSSVREQLESIEARDDFEKTLAEAFDLELLEEAKARVQLKTTPRNWEIFEKLAIEGRRGPDVAQEMHMQVGAVLMARSRVQQELRKEIRRLERSGLNSREGER